MYTDQRTHASLSGNLPEKSATPPVEGNNTAVATNPGSPTDPLEIRLARAILTNDGITPLPASPHKYESMEFLACSARDSAVRASTRDEGKTIFLDFDRVDVDAYSPRAERVTFVELSIREALKFTELARDHDYPIRYNTSFLFELGRLVNRELAILLQEWDELTGQAPSKGVATNA